MEVEHKSLSVDQITKSSGLCRTGEGNGDPDRAQVHIDDDADRRGFIDCTGNYRFEIVDKEPKQSSISRHDLDGAIERDMHKV